MGSFTSLARLYQNCCVFLFLVRIVIQVVMNKQKAQQEAIDILKVFQENIKNDVYVSLQKAIKNDIIVSTYAKMDINGWSRMTGHSVAAESLYQYFKKC